MQNVRCVAGMNALSRASNWVRSRWRDLATLSDGAGRSRRRETLVRLVPQETIGVEAGSHAEGVKLEQSLGLLKPTRSAESGQTSLRNTRERRAGEFRLSSIGNGSGVVSAARALRIAEGWAAGRIQHAVKPHLAKDKNKVGSERVKALQAMVGRPWQIFLCPLCSPLTVKAITE